MIFFSVGESLRIVGFFENVSNTGKGWQKRAFSRFCQRFLTLILKTALKVAVLWRCNHWLIIMMPSH